MSSDLYLVIREIPYMIWNMIIDVKLPGLSFSPAVMMFGIMSFGLAIKLLKGVLNITSDGLSESISNRIRSESDD